jgi:hypothetical protein
VTAVYLELGSKRVFACSIEWPGWARSGRDEAAALAALEAYSPRYAPVAAAAGLAFEPGSFEVLERVRGNATTDFGAPGVAPDLDAGPSPAAAAARDAALLAAVWSYFDQVVAAAPANLRKGPRGGGRDRDKIVGHVQDAEFAYASAIGLRGKTGTRSAILAVVGKASPAHAGTGLKWPARYMARRVAWHALDHAWEIEDRTPEQARGRRLTDRTER